MYAGRKAETRPETADPQADSDIYAAGAAVYATKRLLAIEGRTLALRVGASFPVSLAVGAAAGWVYQRSGATVKRVLEAVKELK